MPKIISLIAKQEKNKLASDSVFLILMEIVLSPTDYVRIVHNNEDITWNDNLWQAFPFELGEMSETTDGSDPSIEIKVSNINRTIQYGVEQSGGAKNCPVRFIVINTKDMANVVLEEFFTVQQCVCDENWVTFTLGAEYSARTRRPLDRYFKNSCRFKFKSARCGYTGTTYTTCGKTLTECRLRGNSQRFGGFPGIDQGGVYVTT